MANSALIDDLLKQFAANPRRVFARLANEYRKRGELDSAIEICRSHVPLQPGYISGHIVLGQALYDSGSLDEARTSFETALALDPENLIALRHMGDISSADGDVTSARGWYRQLLEIDPQNEEVASLVESLGITPAAATGSASAPGYEGSGWGEVNLEPIEIVSDDALTEATASEEEAEEEIAGPALEEVEEEVTVEQPVDQGAILDEAFAASGMEELDVEGAEVGELPTIEGLETTALQEELSETASPLELVDLADLAPDNQMGATEDAVDAEPTRPLVGPLFAAEPFEERSDDDLESDESASAFATETMAELYLQQGFPDRALAIYRELAARSPDDVSLRARLAELEEGEAPEEVPVAATAKASRTAREFFGVLAYRRAPRVALSSESDSVARVDESSDSASAADEGAAATLAGAFGADTGAARDEDPVEAPAEVRNGKPGREASSALSLDDVFRDSPVAEDSRPRSGLSFDEFFARREDSVLVERPNGSVTAEAEEAATSEDHAPDDAPHDLELFHAWLDGLKG